MKILILPCTSSDAGKYASFKEVIYEQEVEARFANDKQNSVYIKGSELIRIGGDPKILIPDREYLWGCFKII